MMARLFTSQLAVLILALGGLPLAACAPAQPQGIQAGAQAPAFNLPAAGGGTVSLADYSGQPVLLFFHMAVG
jgi:hypothetical protein